MITTKTLSIAAGATVEVFTELNTAPVIGSVWIQVVSTSSALGPSIQLSQDSSGTQLGPYLNIATMEQPSQAVQEGTTLHTVKDPVYLTNSSGDTVTVGIAVFSDN